MGGLLPFMTTVNKVIGVEGSDDYG